MDVEAAFQHAAVGALHALQQAAYATSLTCMGSLLTVKLAISD
jgi:hypothetical protein